jgi:hypothetical protein
LITPPLGEGGVAIDGRQPAWSVYTNRLGQRDAAELESAQATGTVGLLPGHARMMVMTQA